MAATGYTPISLYYSTTASAVPTAGNLANGELALNIADMKLYAKNSAGTVTLLASNASTTGVDSLSFGSTGLTPSTATTGAITVAGTLNVANGGTGLTSLTAGYIPYGNGTSALASSSSLFFDGTNLGIGTSSPSAKLQVGWTNDQLRFTNPSGGVKRIGASYTGYVSGNDYAAIDLGTSGSSGGNLLFKVTPSGGSLTTAATLDEAGNLGLGVTPSAWTIGKAFQVNGASVLSTGTEMYLSANAFYGASAWTYRQSDFASQYYQLNGAHVWRTASSGTAGNAISFTQAMTLDASGNLLVGATTAPSGGAGKLALYGGSGGGVQMVSAANSGGSLLAPVNGGGQIFYTYSGALGSETYTEQARITSSGAWSFGSSGTATGTSGQVLTSAGSGAAPTWSTPTGVTTGKSIAMAMIFGF